MPEKEGFFDRKHKTTSLIESLLNDMFRTMSKNCKYYEADSDFNCVGMCFYDGVHSHQCTPSLCKPLKENFGK